MRRDPLEVAGAERGPQHVDVTRRRLRHEQRDRDVVAGHGMTLPAGSYAGGDRGRSPGRAARPARCGPSTPAPGGSRPPSAAPWSSCSRASRWRRASDPTPSTSAAARARRCWPGRGPSPRCCGSASTCTAPRWPPPPPDDRGRRRTGRSHGSAPGPPAPSRAPTCGSTSATASTCCPGESTSNRCRRCRSCSPTPGRRRPTAPGASSRRPSSSCWSSRLRPQGRLELATDDAAYGAQMLDVLGRCPRLRGGPVTTLDGPATFYERRARAAGRQVLHLRYVVR